MVVIGAFIMTLSFLAYGIGSVTLERFRIVGIVVLVFLSLGVLFDISTITLMILAANDTLTTWYGAVGVLAFLVMLVNTAWAWDIYFKKGLDGRINKWLLNYTKAAYFFWVVVYLLGIVLLIWF